MGGWVHVARKGICDHMLADRRVALPLSLLPLSVWTASDGETTIRTDLIFGGEERLWRSDYDG